MRNGFSFSIWKFEAPTYARNCRRTSKSACQLHPSYDLALLESTSQIDASPSLETPERRLNGFQVVLGDPGRGLLHHLDEPVDFPWFARIADVLPVQL